MLTLITVAAIAAVAGYIAGQARERGRHHHFHMNHWKASVLAAAIAPRIEPPTIDLEAVR